MKKMRIVSRLVVSLDFIGSPTPSKVVPPSLPQRQCGFSATASFFVNGHIASNPNKRFNFSLPFKKRKISRVGGHVDDNHRKTTTCGSRSRNDCLDCMDCFLGICAVPGCCMVAVSAAEAAASARGGARR